MDPTPLLRRRARNALLLSGILLVAACEVQWGGARMAVEEPARPGAEASDSAAAEERTLPLPRGPLLVLVRIGEGGAARALPVARLETGRPAPLGWPEDPPSDYRERFSSAFLAAGTELPLHFAGFRVGSLIVGESGGGVNAGCPPSPHGRALFPPGVRPPTYAFAVTPADGEGLPQAVSAPDVVRDLRVFAPILAERILRDAGVERPFLARQVDLQAVDFPADERPGFAATYVINDTLAAGPPPTGGSASLFFLARYRPAEGYVPAWSWVREYDAASGKELLTYLGWTSTPAGRLYVVRRTDADSSGPAVVVVPPAGAEGGAEPELVPLGGEGCAALPTLSAPSTPQ